MTHPNDKVIGANLRLIRLKQNVSQERCGDMLNPPVSGAQVQKYENGSNRVSAAQLMDFAKALNVKYSDFFNIGTVILADKAITRLTERDLVILLRQLRPDLKQCVESIIAALAQEKGMVV